MKKHWIPLLLAVLICIAGTGCSLFQKKEDTLPPSQLPPEILEDTSTPEGALADLLESARDWNLPAIDARLPDGSTLGSRIPPALETLVYDVLERMDYRIYSAAVEGDSAAVEVAITTVDAEGAITDAAVKAAAYYAKQKLTGGADDPAGAVTEVLGSINVDKLSTTTTDATAYMIADGSGGWKLDVSDERNLPLLNAATGGAVELAAKLGELAERYGFALSDVG